MPVGYGIDGFVCPYCTAVDSVPENLRRRIRDFYKGLRRFDMRSKQMPQLLKDRLQKSLGTTGRVNWINLYFLGLFCFIWATIISQYWGNWPKGTSNWADFIYNYMPMILPMFVLPWFAFTSWRKRYLRISFQARLPLQPKGPARCRLCGAPLEDSGVIRRCAHCGTDSVVSEKPAEKFQENLAETIEKMEAALEEKLFRKIRKLKSLYLLTPIVYQLALLALLLVSGGIAFLLNMGNASSGYRNQQYLYNAIGYIVGICIVGWFLYKKVKSLRKLKIENAASKQEP